MCHKKIITSLDIEKGMSTTLKRGMKKLIHMKANSKLKYVSTSIVEIAESVAGFNFCMGYRFVGGISMEDMVNIIGIIIMQVMITMVKVVNHKL